MASEFVSYVGRLISVRSSGVSKPALKHAWWCPFRCPLIPATSDIPRLNPGRERGLSTTFVSAIGIGNRLRPVNSRALCQLSYTPRWVLKCTLTDSKANSSLSLLVSCITPACVLRASSGALSSERRSPGP